MSSNVEDSPITYQQLADLERDFDDVETEIIRRQVQLNRPLYEKRAQIVSQIPNFWPLVLEQAPADIDEFIQPTDSALLLSSLTSLSVSHFEIEDGAAGAAETADPRSVLIRWEFAENEYFEDRVLEKKFWYRRASDGFVGLVSEPVDIRWKEGKDLTDGLLSMVKKIWDQEQANPKPASSDKRKNSKAPLTPEQKALAKKIEETGMGGVSFFAWFGYIGQRISAEESRLANEKEDKARRRRLEGKEEPDAMDEDDDEADEDDDDADDDEDSLEIFPEGDSLALAITEDLWPGAIRYFTQAQENDLLSDIDFESDEDMDEDEDEKPQDAAPAQKKRKV